MIVLLWLKMAVMMSALSRSSQANKLKQPATTTGAVIRCTGPCGHSETFQMEHFPLGKKKKNQVHQNILVD